MRPPIEAARKVAEHFGVRADRCEILQDAHTLVVRLSDTLVARVVTDAGGPRKGTEWFAKETAVAAHLSGHQAPVIPLHPDIPWQAHQKDGFIMNFWQYVISTGKQAEPGDIGRTLQHCHEVLRSFPEQLSPLSILYESLEILESPGSSSAFPFSVRQLLHEHIAKSISILAAVPHQALHGDAHMGNIMMISDGLVWTDWEDAFCGPIEWDIASIIWNAKLLDQDSETADAIIAGYEACGKTIDHDILEQCLVARAAVMSAWYPILYPKPNVDRVRKLEHRIDWLSSIPV